MNLSGPTWNRTEVIAARHLSIIEEAMARELSNESDRGIMNVTNAICSSDFAFATSGQLKLPDCSSELRILRVRQEFHCMDGGSSGRIQLRNDRDQKTAIRDPFVR